MAREDGLSHLFVEPSGFVLPLELRTQIAVSGRTAKMESGPVLLLLDGMQPEAPFQDEVLHITMQQATQSDLVAVTKVDSADPDDLIELERSLRELAPSATIHRISSVSGEGVEELFAAMFSDD